MKANMESNMQDNWKDNKEEIKRLIPKDPGKLPYNYSLYTIEGIVNDTKGRFPTEYCKQYKSKLKVVGPYKRITEY